MNLSRPFVRRPVASSMIAVALVLVGALAYGLLPVSPLPQVDFPTIRVNASLPGASPETMAASVAAPLERALGSIAGIRSISSESSQGTTGIYLEFALGRNIDGAARDVQAAINAARGQLPAGMPGNPTFRKSNSSLAPIMGLALSSPNMAPGALYDIAATILAQKISQIAGVGEVTLGGSSLPAVRVQLNPNALAHYGIALDEVRRAITATNSLRPRGVVEDGERQWEVQISNSQLRHAADYLPLVIRYVDGAPVRLGDVAKVIDAVEDRNSMGFHNDRPAVLLMISRQPGANIIATIDAINAQLPQLRALLPADADLAVVSDRSPGIRATLHESQKTLMIAAALVMLVVFLFLGSARAALIPCLAIPVSIIGTFGIMYLYGFSLNNLSLMALIVAAGLVVDDAIVVLENITRHIERGLSPLRATFRGAGEVGFTLLAMNLSLVAVFVSILFMGGLIEKLFREFSITLAAAMLVSLIASLTLTPTLCARWLVKHDATPPTRFRQRTERIFDAMKAFYARSLDWVLRHATLTLIILIGTIALNISLYVKIPKGFLPTQDTGQLSGYARGDDAFSFEMMKPKIEAYRRFIMSDPAVQDVTGTAGGRSVSSAKMDIRLKPRSQRKESADEIIARLRANAPVVAGGSLYAFVSQDIDAPRTSEAGSYELSVMCGDVDLLRRWMPRINAAMQDIPELVDIYARSDSGTTRVNLTIDREAARRVGVDMQMITQVLNSSFSQRQIATLYDQLNQYRVIMELEPQYTADPTVLDRVQVIAADGSRVPLSAFARYSYSATNDRVRHRSQFASESVGFSLAEGVSLEEGLAAIDRAMAKIMLPGDLFVGMSGSAGTFQRSLQAQPLLILGVLIAVYLVLGILYESLVHPLTILSTLPSAGLGALLALRLTGTEFTLIALLGLFLLIGIVMKNAILMIDFAIATERRNELPPKEAIFEAAVLRLRPILMTNFASLLGALPLVLATGEGVEMRRPLGLAIVGGLFVSQLLTLYTVPIVYLWLDRIRLKFKRQRVSTSALGAPATAER